jgi:hypothetical protein
LSTFLQTNPALFLCTVDENTPAPEPSASSPAIKQKRFTARQVRVIKEAVSMAEELVGNFYKLSSVQWRRLRFDIKTLADLEEDEIVTGPFAQVIRYEAKPKDVPLGSSTYDYYKICLQDQAILRVTARHPEIQLYPLVLYIVTHELIHIIRFCRFLQRFDASAEEKHEEEKRVHERTHEILTRLTTPGLAKVLHFFRQWCEPVDSLR